MIFLQTTIDESDDVFVLGPYYPYNDPKFEKGSFSNRLLQIKYRHDSDRDPQAWKQRNKTLALRRFFQDVNPLIASGIAVAVVPSSDPEASTSGIQQLAKELAAKERIDATGCLVRFKKIPKLAEGGSRRIAQHLRSIRVEQAEIIQGHEVLLLDDVTTSGNSLSACRQLLLDAGAVRVKCMALGQTTHSE